MLDWTWNRGREGRFDKPRGVHTLLAESGALGGSPVEIAVLGSRHRLMADYTTPESELGFGSAHHFRARIKRPFMIGNRRRIAGLGERLVPVKFMSEQHHDRLKIAYGFTAIANITVADSTRIAHMSGGPGFTRPLQVSP